MDSRVYFHQYRRPRNNNPTYKSTNVQNSMIYFNNGYTTQPSSNRNKYIGNQSYQQPVRVSQKSYERQVEVRRQPEPEYNFNQMPLNSYQQVQNGYRQQQGQYSHRQPAQIHYKQPVQNINRQQIQNNYNPPIQPTRQQNSKLSNYGQRSLNLDQRGVCHKQTSKFDIINFKPRQYSQDIRQYPWLTVQNKDDVYYRRMNEIYNGGGNVNNDRNKTSQKHVSYVAGKHTYDLEPKFHGNPEESKQKRFTAKMLNHMDELQHNLA